jgi:hypothetical protein
MSGSEMDADIKGALARKLCQDDYAGKKFGDLGGTCAGQ